MTLHYTTSHYTTLHYITLHFTKLHYTTLHYTTLHYTTLQQWYLSVIALEKVSILISYWNNELSKIIKTSIQSFSSLINHLQNPFKSLVGSSADLPSSREP